MSRHHKKKQHSAMNRHEFLYWLEHVHLPDSFFELKSRFINAIIYNEDSFQQIMFSIAADMNAKVDFVKDDFSAEGCKLDEGEYAVVMYLPQPKEPTECLFVVCRFDEECTEQRYITAELGEEGDVFVCEWVNGKHYNYGICDLEDALDTCLNLPSLKEDENAACWHVIGDEIKVLCDASLCEAVKKSVSTEKGIEFFDINQDCLPTLENNTIGVVISATREMLANTMQKAKESPALMVPILIADESVQAEPTEPPMMIIEKSRFDSEKELCDFLGRIIDSLLYVDTFDLGFMLNEAGRLFFTYAAGEDLAIIADKLRDSLKNHDDICAKGSVVLAAYNIANADSFDAENFTSWTKGLHKLFGESCNFIDDVRDSSSENSSVSMWIKL